MHDHPHTRIGYSWLSVKENFIIRTFGKLTVTMTLEFGDVHEKRDQDASAHAKWHSAGKPVELWLGRHDDDTMFE